MTKLYYDTLLALLDLIPDSPELVIPDGVYSGLDTIFGLLNFFFPAQYFSPLISFIITLTLFRISWSIFVTFKK